MESLRSQLAETQGALTERDKKFRQLRVDHMKDATTWAKQKVDLEKRIADLESENQALKKQLPSTTTDSKVGQPASSTNIEMKDSENGLGLKAMNSLPALTTKQNADGDEVLNITRAQMMKAEADFARLVNELSEKTKLCTALEAKLARSHTAPALELSQDDIMSQWTQLRDRICTFSERHLSNTFETKLMSDSCQRDFTALSPHWKSYTNTNGLPSYIFRAFIWRYLLRFFDIFCRAYGRDVSQKIAEVAGLLWKRVPDAEFNAWRIRTAALVNDICPVDGNLVREVAQKILEQIAPMVANKDSMEHEAELHHIVKRAADLSAVFDRSNFVVLMHNEPGSALMHSFPYASNLMDMTKKLGTKGVVDLMITPSLLKKETEYLVLVKAEVACG